MPVILYSYGNMGLKTGESLGKCWDRQPGVSWRCRTAREILPQIKRKVEVRIRARGYPLTCVWETLHTHALTHKYTYIHIKKTTLLLPTLTFYLLCWHFHCPLGFFSFFKIIFHCSTVSYFHIMWADHIDPSLPSSNSPGVSLPHLPHTHTWIHIHTYLNTNTYNTK